MNTPENITSLKHGQIFVFGSNRNGTHAAGAAATAYIRFGAIWGKGVGLQGRSYAIDTMSGLEALKDGVARFLHFVAEHPELTFLVTKIGTGIAGHAVADVAPLFDGRTPNVVLPVEFEQVNA